MAAGAVTVNEISFAVPDNSCDSLTRAWDSYQWRSGSLEHKALGCSDNPVVSGSFLYAQTSSVGASGYSISSVDATAFRPLDWFSVPHLLQAVLMVCVVFMFVKGYDSGNRL